MLRTGKPTVRYDSLREKIAIVDAGRKSVKLGRSVTLKEIMNRRARLYRIYAGIVGIGFLSKAAADFAGFVGVTAMLLAVY